MNTVELFKYKSIDECPMGVDKLSKEGQKQWMEIANALLLAGDGKGYACARAWQAIQEGYVQNEDGEWCPNMGYGVTPQHTAGLDEVVEEKACYSLEDATHEIKGVQVFETGVWNGGKYTEKDLQEMVDNFGVFEAPLKIGHDSKQKLAGQPSVGWISKLYKKGNKLFADIKDIPKVVYDLIKKGAYKKRSAELYYNVVDSTGKALNNVFGGLALLGAELPAINTLADVVALYEKSVDTKEIKIIMFDIKGGQDMDEIVKDEVVEIKEEEIITPIEEVNEVPAESKVVEEVVIVEEKKDEPVVEVKSEPVVLPTEDIEAIKAENLALKAEKEEAELKAFMKSIERKIPPVISSMVFEALKKSDNKVTVEFSLKDKVESTTNREFLKKLFSSMPDMAILDTVTGNIVAEDISKQQKAIMKAYKLVEEKKIEFKQALLDVYVAHPELVEQAKPISQ